MDCSEAVFWSVLGLGNLSVIVYLSGRGSEYSKREITGTVAADYDEVPSDVKESQESSLDALKSANAPDAGSVVLELDQADGLDHEGPGGGSSPKNWWSRWYRSPMTSSRASRVSWSGTAPRLPVRRTVTRTAWSAKAESVPDL
jgi:hypothetical protein